MKKNILLTFAFRKILHFWLKNKSELSLESLQYQNISNFSLYLWFAGICFPVFSENPI